MGFRQYALNVLTRPVQAVKNTAQALLGSTVSKHFGNEYDKFFNLPYNPDELVQKKGTYTIHDQMRQDDQVSAVMRMKKHLVLGTGWDLVNEDDENEQDEVLEFLTWALDEAQDKPFNKVLLSILAALDYGFSVSEKCYGPVRKGLYKGKIAYWAIKTRPPHGITFQMDPHGNIEAVYQDDILLKPWDKFIHFTHNDEFDNPFGNSDFNIGMYRAWHSKNLIIKFWNIFLERFGSPTVVAKYGKGATTTDRDNLLKMIKNMSAKTGFVIPEDVVMDALNGNTGTAQAGFEAAIDKYNIMIARAAMVPDLIGISGEKTGGGSYALGDKQFELLYATLAVTRSNVERMVNRDIIAPLLAWNFGDPEQFKIKWRLKPMTSGDKIQAATAWLSAVSGNVFKPNDDEINHFRELVGFPQGEIVRPEPPKALAPYTRPDGDEPNDDAKPGEDEGGDKNPGEGTPKDKERPAPQNDNKPKELAQSVDYGRTPNFKALEEGMDRNEQDTVRDLSRVVKDAITDLTDWLKAKRVIEDKRIDLLNEIPLKYERQFRTAIKSSLKDAMRLGMKSAKSELTGVENYAMVEDVAGLNKDEARSLLDEKAAFAATVEWDALKKAVTPVIIDAVQTGKSIRQTMDLLDEALQEWDIEYDSPRLRTIARTNISNVMNEGRKQVFQENSDLILAYQYKATMDNVTTDICRELHNKVVRPAELGKYNPPNHFNCRSVMVAITVGEQYEFSDDIPPVKELPGGFLELA